MLSRSDVKEMDEAVTLDLCQIFVDLCIVNVARLHSSAVTCEAMQELGISSPPSDWVWIQMFSVFPMSLRASYLFI